MMKTHLYLAILSLSHLSAEAQPVTQPEASLTLTMKYGGGVNGIGVAYNPKAAIYYSAIAGSSGFPLECFSGEENIYQDSVGFDARGLWYNDKSNAIEGNSYQGEGIYIISLDTKGLPSETAEKKYPGSQPDGQSVGAYDASSKEILYFDNTAGKVARYKLSSGKLEEVIPLIGCPTDFSNLNNAVIYTGEKDYEMGFYDFPDARIHLFNKKGEFQTTITLPDDAPFNELFNFSYANGYAFLFDKDLREWIGYKIFQ